MARTTGRRRAGLIVALVLSLLGVLAGCSDASTSPDKIAFIVGDGQGGSDAKVHKIVYPGNAAQAGVNEKVLFVPGNSRNYVIDNRDTGAVDRKTPATGYTKERTPVAVSLSAFWTVNQDESILKDKFFPYCQKYGCADDGTAPLNDRSSTDGWTKMLDADFGPAIDDSVREVLPTFDDKTWSEQAQWTDVATAVSDAFNAHMRARTGYTDDIFCGSGDVSSWSGGVAGQGTYTCGKVRFTVTSIVATDASQQAATNQAASAKQQEDSNAQILKAAKAKYGDNAGDILGQQDTIKACRDAGQTCVVVVGGNGQTSISVPR